MNKPYKILHIALQKTRRHFDYLPPQDGTDQPLRPGLRIKIPFRNKEHIGLLVGMSHHSAVAPNKLKHAIAIIDPQPLFSEPVLKLCQWASDYYHTPLGEVFSAALPKKLRLGQAAKLAPKKVWRLTSEGKELDLRSLQRAPKQQTIIKLFRDNNGLIDETNLSQYNLTATVLKPLISKQLLQEEILSITTANKADITNPGLALNQEQQAAFDMIMQQSDGFASFLLDGITGSGKTEVYLQLISEQLRANKQCLVLIPEIGLTPQTFARFKARFNVTVSLMHSGLNDTERMTAWLQAQQGIARIIIGTRSAVFTPLPDLGLIIIDEEHDASFKQFDSFHYSARDLAVVRAQLENIPIVLGTATPSLESYYNSQQQRYQHLLLTQRAGDAIKPQMRIIDLRQQRLSQGLSHELIKAIKQHLAQQKQVLLFINRRGYAPVLLCHQCGWVADCNQCDAHLTLHHQPTYLQCHHCGFKRGVYKQCQQCHESPLLPIGLGTEKIEELLQQRFPTIPVIRIDRDSTRRKDAMQHLLQQIQTGKPQILIGTQMLAKGHHFPQVTLVGILDADSGLLSGDFRACERIGQLITQVAGRAGRADAPGEVLIQTHQPQNALLNLLIQNGYHAFADKLLEERKAAKFPPFAYLAIFRAQAKQKTDALNFLEKLKRAINSNYPQSVKLLGPIPAPMTKKAGFYRAQLLLQAENRKQLQHCLAMVMQQQTNQASKTQVQWTLDVDPFDVY